MKPANNHAKTRSTALCRILILPIVMVLSAIPLRAANYDQEQCDIPAEAVKYLENAALLVDNGMPDAAITEFEYLLSQYPDSYAVQYEYAYMLVKAQKLDKALEVSKNLTSHPKANERAYDLHGIILSLNGKRKDAKKVLMEGIKRYPKAGMLYLELGTLENMDQNYEKALEHYCNGIEADPKFASNYYRAAQLYARSNEPMWGMALAETEILLKPTDTERHIEMSKTIRAILEAQAEKAALKRDILLSDSVRVEVKPGDLLQEMSLINFGNIYSGLFNIGVLIVHEENDFSNNNVDLFTGARRSALLNYTDNLKSFFGKGMQLLEYQKRILNAGHWDAYNYFIIGYAYPEELKEWLENNEKKMSSFLKWLTNNPLVLDHKRSVSPISHLKYHKNISQYIALYLQTMIIMR